MKPVVTQKLKRSIVNGRLWVRFPLEELLHVHFFFILSSTTQQAMITEFGGKWVTEVRLH